MSFENVLWLGGPPGSGKTTVAEWFATAHGLRYWGADKSAHTHHRRMIEEQFPAIREWEAMTHDQRWLGDPSAMADLSLTLSGRRGEMVIEDLRAEPPTVAIIVEGTPLRPSAIEPVIASTKHALFLVPTPAAEERNLRRRGGHGHMLTSHPAQAETNRIAREVLVAERIAEEANERAMRMIRPDEQTSLSEVKAAVENHFAPLLGALPLARSDRERGVLRRAENLALVEHLKDFLMERPDLGTPETLRGTFVCECGKLGETEHIEMTIADFDTLTQTKSAVIVNAHLPHAETPTGQPWP